MPFISSIIAGIGAAAAAAGSFFSGIGAAVGGLGFFGKALLTVGLNLAMSAVQGALGKKDEQAPPSGVDLELQIGEGGSRKVMCGYCFVAGHLVYPNAYGPANQTLQQAFQLSDFPITSLDAVFIDGEEVTLGAEDATKGFVVNSGEFAGRIWFKVYDGWQDTADPGLEGNSNPEGRWTEDHIGIGNAYVVATLLYDREALTQPPAFVFAFEGAPLYDWRKDDSVGGDGDHRWDDITTWEYTENPILMAYAYHRGIAFNGDLFCGMEVQESDLPLARWTSAANICDETVESAPRYRCSIGLDCNAEHGDNVEAIMASCGGMIVDGVGEVFVIVGSDQETVATITDLDLVAGEPVSVQPRRSMGDLVNSVSGTFPNRANQGNPTGYQTARDETLVTTDRRSRDVALNFPAVGDAKQAGRLAALYLSENRFGATAEVVVRPRWQVLEPGDWITWNSDRYGSRVYMIVDMQLKADLSDGPRNVQLSLQERSGDIYESVGVTVPPTPLGPATPLYASELQDFTVTAAIGTGSDSIVYPIIRVAWSAPTDPTVSGVILQWRPKAQPDVIFEKTVSRDRTVAILTEGVVSVTDYEVRHILITDPPRPVVATDWDEVTTLDAPSSDIVVTLGRVSEDVAGTLESLRADHNSLRALVTDLADTVSGAGLSNRLTLGRVQTRVGTAEATVKSEIITRASEVAAIGGQITEINASLTSANSQIEGNANAISVTQAEVSDLDGVVTALSVDLTAVEAVAGQASAGGLIKWEATAAPSGVLARFSIYGKATSGGTYRDGGASLDITATEAFWNFFSDQFRILKPDGTPIAVFGSDAGDLVLQNIRVGTVTFDQLSSANGKLVLKGSGDDASIEVFS